MQILQKTHNGASSPHGGDVRYSGQRGKCYI